MPGDNVQEGGFRQKITEIMPFGTFISPSVSTINQYLNSNQ